MISMQIRPDCAACAFFREVQLQSGHKRRLCMLTGERRPAATMIGCQFMPGAWADIDAILDLPKSRVYGNTGSPDNVKLVAAFSRKGKNVTDIHALDDSIGFPINHTAKAERQFVRPEYREVPVAHVARERTGCLFIF